MYRCKQALLLSALLVVAASAGGTGSSSAGGSMQMWHHADDYEADTVDLIVLAVLMSLAIVFEHFWRRCSRAAKRGYRFGQATGGGTAIDSHATPEGETGHVLLKEELVNRAAGEFMTLGFLAFCTFFCNVTGALDALATHVKPAGITLPQTGQDWLHVIEIVHMKLFWPCCSISSCSW
jgi:hypothetical protein